MSNRHGLKGFSADAIPALSSCESPIEGKFVQALFDYAEDKGWKFLGYKPSNDARCYFEFDKQQDLGVTVCVSLQMLLIDIRVDVVITYVHNNGIRSTVVVELDGKQFHSTDKQRSDDRFRDLRIASWGMVCLRFTGAEVHEVSDCCVVNSIIVCENAHLHSHRIAKSTAISLGAEPSAIWQDQFKLTELEKYHYMKQLPSMVTM